ncbi:MAG: MarR family transcriptional regulator [Bacteroidales bacterium]|jgi:DNA-binding MarR family transcriptional regulator|nr:MarR family transcriptional regulator [Bacteroidales bacterium]
MKDNLKDNIVKFTRLISTAEEDAMKLYEMQDLTATQFHYLEIIGELENPTLTELATVMKLTKPSVTATIDRLIIKGLVRKVHSDIDKRSSHLHLTEIGEQINKRHDFAHDFVIGLIAKRLSQEEIKSFTAFLDKITE